MSYTREGSYRTICPFLLNFYITYNINLPINRFGSNGSSVFLAAFLRMTKTTAKRDSKNSPQQKTNPVIPAPSMAPMIRSRSPSPMPTFLSVRKERSSKNKPGRKQPAVSINFPPKVLPVLSQRRNPRRISPGSIPAAIRYKGIFLKRISQNVLIARIPMLPISCQISKFISSTFLPL